MPAVLAGAALAAAGCGQTTSTSASKLDAVCEERAALLRETGEPTDLTQAVRALGVVVRLDHSLIVALTPPGSRGALLAGVRGSLALATRTLDSIRQTDQRAGMTPLRTGVPDTRRAIAGARGLLAQACPR